MTELFDLNGGVETTSLEDDYGVYLVKVDGSGEPTDSGFTTLGTLASYIKTAETIVPEGVVQSTLHLRLSSDESITSSLSTPIPWDTEVENTSDGEISWTFGTPTRVTIGAGVTRVAISAGVRVNGADGTVFSYLTVNGANLSGASAVVSSMDVTNGATHNLYSEIPVSSGDYIELVSFMTASNSVRNHEWTFFKVRVIERTSP